MDYSLQLLLLISLVCLLSVWFVKYHGKSSSNLPPGPKPLPIIGNILELISTDKPHRALADLSKTYGPIMYLKLGSVHTLIVSSSSIAKQLFLKHDSAFCSRQIPDAIRALDHHLHSVGWLPVSPKWRTLRKVSAVHLFSVSRLDGTRLCRQKKVDELLEYITECCKKGKAVGVGEVGFTTTLNLLSNTLFSINLATYNSAGSQELKDIVRRIFDCVGKPNVADFFPLLTYFDPLRVRRDTAASFSKLFEVFDDMISQRLSTESSSDDVLQTLLDISKEEASDLTHDDIKHLLLDLIAAGTDTTSSTLEWAMTELLCNPSKMEKAQEELNGILGEDVPVQESDFERLPYLQAVVKETMRLHPAVPLLLPRKAEDNTKLCNYVVPKDTQLLVNAWAIGRDPQIWKNPYDFLPERFLECDIDMRGVDFELIPFGAGRRICLGMSLAYRMLHHMLAALLHAFRWSLADGFTKEDVDMDERCGRSLQKAKPLMALPLPKSI